MKEKIKGIYKLEFPNGKVYIGQSINILKRFITHKSEGIINRTTSSVHYAIRKHGWDNITKEILISGDDITQTQLNGYEIFWITTYNSNNRNFGYNLTPGGQGNKNIDGKRSPLYGKKRSPEFVEKMRAGVIKSFELGLRKKSTYRSVTEKSIQSHLKRKKKIIQLDMNNNFIREWDSCKDAGEELKIYACNINKVCKKVNESYKGFKWQYV